MRRLLIINEQFTGLDLSFKSYIQLTERHTTIRRSIANLAKIGLRELVEDVFNNRYKEKASAISMFFSRQRVLQEYLDEAKPNNNSPAANCNIEGLLGNRHVLIPVELYLVTGEYPSGKFEASGPKILIYIHKDKLDIMNVPEFVFETLVHELTHYYQYIGKYTSKEKEIILMDDMPEMFSYTAYVLLPDEVEARIAAMYEKWRRNNELKQKSFFRIMLYMLSSSVFLGGNVYNLKSSPVRYVKTLERDGDYYEAFIAKYFLSAGIAKTRYFRFVKDDEDYNDFIKAYNPDDIEHIKSLFNGVYQYCKTVFPQAYNSQEDAYEMFSADTGYVKNFFKSYKSAMSMAKRLQNEVEEELNAA